MKAQIQKIGRTLSAMVMPNLAAFIAWGLITALFIATGWLPNEKFAAIVDPMLKYVLPLLVGYTGGQMITKSTRGGVVGAIATAGVIIGSNIPMFLGAMLAGPLGGVAIKKWDDAMEDKIPAGFEMLVQNFSAGIIGFALALICFSIIGPVAEFLTNLMGSAVGSLVEHKLLPLASIFVEPAKILFLNNAINHGVFTPLGTEQAKEIGRSIYFMIESNPGPGLGLLLAYMAAGKGSAKNSAGGAAIIHFFGGIHEIYFPYVLMNPILVLAMIGGGFAGVLVLSIFGGGLVAPASPGSIFAEMIMTPKGAYFANIAGIVAGGVVSFLLSTLLLKAFGANVEAEDLEAAKSKVQEMKLESKGAKKIVFACDAGMGSSVMASTRFKKMLKDAGLDILVSHAAVGEIPADSDIVIVHRDLASRAKEACPKAQMVEITNFLNAPEYAQLVEQLKKQ